MIKIRPYKIKKCNINVPGSKSYTHRALICSALSTGLCEIKGVLKGEDTLLTCLALKKLGASIYNKNDVIVINGVGDNFKQLNSPIYLGASGTSMRFISSLVTLGLQKYFLYGNNRMNNRPILHLMNAIEYIGCNYSFLYNYGAPPIEILRYNLYTNIIEIFCNESSQYLSSLLLISPYLKNGLKIKVIGKIVSRYYIDITIDIMRQFGIFVDRIGYNFFSVTEGKYYISNSYYIEPDCSSACYFWAAAAISGGSVTISGINLNTKQGDIKFLNILKKMGCVIRSSGYSITVIGSNLRSVEIDVSDMPDIVPTLSVVAIFANGITEITGISHLDFKESKRIQVLFEEFVKMGIFVARSKNKFLIKSGIPKGRILETYGDHRIAMSFALIGLKVPGIIINEEFCVNKSFPNFWREFKKLYC